MKKKFVAIIYAIFAAVFYALNVPCSKVLLNDIPPVFMAAFLYFGAGAGIGIIYIFTYKNEDKKEHLSIEDLPFTIGMIILDIIAPILLMLGIKLGTSANANLLGNFEIVVTSIIALVFFKEIVSKNLWIAIFLITVSSLILTYDGKEVFCFSLGSLFVLGATFCWGMENNCTRKISEKSTYQIVTIKGLCSGLCSLIIATIIEEKSINIKNIFSALILGFIAYGLSIFTYVRAQKYIGAAKTSAFYSIAPFIGIFLSFVFLKEEITLQYLIALIIMIIGTVLVVKDTLTQK